MRDEITTNRTEAADVWGWAAAPAGSSLRQQEHRQVDKQAELSPQPATWRERSHTPEQIQRAAVYALPPAEERQGAESGPAPGV